MCLIIIIILNELFIVMNEIGSLFLATLVLAIGGMGLYYYKAFDLNENEDRLEEQEEEENDDYDNEENYEENYEEPEIFEKKSRPSKSKKNKRKAVGTKRRYYY